MAGTRESCNTSPSNDLSQKKTAFLSWFNHLNEKSSKDSLLFVVNNCNAFLSLLEDKDTNDDMMSSAITILGKACMADNQHRKMLSKFMKNLCLSMDHIINIFTKYLLSLKKVQMLKKHLDAVLYLTKFLNYFQLTLPSFSSNSLSMLLLSMEHFSDHLSFSDKKELSERERLQLEDLPENFRDLSIIPTYEDIHTTCSFLRPNLVKGSYRDVEHYLDVQFRLLREDYIKPLRDGVAEYTKMKKDTKSFKSSQNVRLYHDVFLYSEEFVDGDLMHKIQFRDKHFSTIKWEKSKRFQTGNLLCLSTDDFCTMSFATVFKREPRELRKGLLLVKFKEINENTLNIDPSMNYVVIELSTLFESYHHNLNVLRKLNDNSLPMKNYIVNVEKKVRKPEYLQSTTVFDMRPLLFPLEMGFHISCQIHEKEMHFTPRSKTLFNVDKNDRPTTSELKLDESQCIVLASEKHKFVHVTNESAWPSASELKMDESQYIALKSAITKEFALIQGPPGTGKTYIGLRIVQLLLHNLDVWFRNDLDSMPMLVVCYTNHALDQFLEGISHLTKKIARFGGRSSNKMIKKFQIKNLVKRAKEKREIPKYIGRRIYEAITEIEKLQKKIGKFESNRYDLSTSKVLQEDTLEEYIPRDQHASLKRGNYRIVDKCQNPNGKIYEWLEIETFSDSQLKIKKCEEKPSITGIRGKEFEIEDKTDIKFIENQRMDYIRNSLRTNPIMKEQRALRIRNVWRLPISERWQLYKFWLNCFLERDKAKYSNFQHHLKIAFEELWDACMERELWVLEDVQVVGMTTTGAAKFRHIIEARNPVVLIVEEAAETLESHIITSLASKTKHVILIGDQQQLRPSPTVYELGVNYGMNVSLFERMIINEVDYCRLLLQHRMRPEIASLIVPHIYPDLENHEIVTKFEHIKGVEKDVFFVTHNFNEQNIQDSKSKANKHEAKFIVRLCQYLIHQGYEPSQITVLTTYSAQLFALKKLAMQYDISEVYFTVVDNFQGEENDIILMSFVRSNNEGNIGFLKVSNRVCVALSRAKKGFYCIGNFALLAEKSELWKNILQTLTTNKSIGPSLRLVCQNHPDVLTDVASDSDFNVVPEGGCNRKCEYPLPCGHLCTLFCHPYDPEHKKFKCKKACTKTCERGHPCQMKCFNDCKPCPVIVEKVLSRCGHTVNAACRENESEIKCLEPCKKFCEEGHPCPKKCFESCGSCNFMVNKIVPNCLHTMKVACSEPEECVKCENPCNGTCPKNHLCQKKCFETCSPCEFVVEKTLACGHMISVECGKKEGEIKCSSACKKLLPCSHQCKNKCYEQCAKTCLELIEFRSFVCGHSVRVECCFAHDAGELAKRCSEPCRKVLLCGHLCKGTCSTCKQGNEHIACNDTCKNILLCGHLCSNKCSKPCIEICKENTKISSLVCRHLLNIECYLANNINELSKRCPNPCKEMLLCGHTCKGTCSSCYQGRLHISCLEICNRTLICGHKCEAKCFMTCPPCRKPCENRCVHKKCPKKCGDPCVRCFKPCNWSCSHKKCTRRCYEVCNRGPCSVKCLKKLPCNHRCIGFCGEPCPKECFMCGENTFKGNSSMLTNKEQFGYIYLEDCQHTLKEDDLRMCLTNSSTTLHELKLKTCPLCGTIIRKNLRFSKIIKSSISDLEKIKQVTMYNKDKNINLQKKLLKVINESNFVVNDIYKPVIKALSDGRVIDIYELTNLKSMIDIAKEIESKHCGLYSMFPLTPFIEKLIAYMRYCREWIIDFIEKTFLSVSECQLLSVSEYQLLQLSKEVYRLSLLSFLLNFTKQKDFDTLPPDFEKCTSFLMSFTSLSDEDLENFYKHSKNFIINLKDLPTKSFYSQEFMNMSALWYRCSKGHIICLSNNFKTSERKECHRCKEIYNKPCIKPSNMGVVAGSYSKANEEALCKKNKPNEQSGRVSQKDERKLTTGKMGKITSISSNCKPKFQRKRSSHVENHAYRRFQDGECSKDVASRKNFETNSCEKHSYPTKTCNELTSKDNASRKLFEENKYETLSHVIESLNRITISSNNSRKNTEKGNY